MSSAMVSVHMAAGAAGVNGFFLTGNSVTKHSATPLIGAINVALATSTARCSIIVVVYNMAREAPRTLFSLSSTYQRNVAADDYEVIVVDNGSTPPFDPAALGGLTGNFRLIRIDEAPPSPVASHQSRSRQGARKVSRRDDRRRAHRVARPC